MFSLLHIEHGHIFRSDWRLAFWQRVFGGFPNPPENPQDQMLAVCLKYKLVLVGSQSGFDEQVSKLGLKGGVEMQFRLLHRNHSPLFRQGMHHDRYQLTDSHANISTADSDIVFEVAEGQVSKLSGELGTPKLHGLFLIIREVGRG